MQSIITQIADQLAPPPPAGLAEPDAEWFERLLASAEGLDEEGVRHAIDYAVANGADENEIEEVALRSFGYAFTVPAHDFEDLRAVADALGPYIERYQSDMSVVDHF